MYSVYRKVGGEGGCSTKRGRARPFGGSRAVRDGEYSSSIQQACMQSQVLSGLTDAHRIRRPREGYKGEEIIRE